MVQAYKNTIGNGIKNGLDNPVEFYFTIKNILSKWKSIESYKIVNDSLLHGDTLKINF